MGEDIVSQLLRYRTPEDAVGPQERKVNTPTEHRSDDLLMPPEIADAWAAVYIDVAEKLDAEQSQGAGDAARHTAAGNVPAVEASAAPAA